MKTVIDDLLSGQYQYIAHQCYATNRHDAKGLAKAIFDKYPYANCYDGTLKQLGTIQIKYGVQNVVNMFAQFYPGKPRSYDTLNKRLVNFRSCLGQILELKDIVQIAFPYKIGCGLAGGYWPTYATLLEQFSEKASFEVLIVRLKD